jgi:hypothetical protein
MSLSGTVPHELTRMEVEYLRFPVACPLAFLYRCVYLKDYYYGYKTFIRKSLSLSGEDEIDEQEMD